MDKKRVNRRDFKAGNLRHWQHSAAYGSFAGQETAPLSGKDRSTADLTSATTEMPFHFFKDHHLNDGFSSAPEQHLTEVDLSGRLKLGGNTERKIELTMDQLQKDFERVSYTAVIQCSGNGRSFFEPRVAGGQWENGSLGNVTWTGARLKDILAKAGIKAGSVEVAFNGIDGPPLPSVPDFVKSLPLDTALDDVIVAYAMNGKPLTILNGVPARLVVPGWFATYWVKSLYDITLLDKAFEGFWMKTAYRIPDTSCACIPPGSKPKKTVPITRMNTRRGLLTDSGANHSAGK
jgi:DMSO/TMAO reductase YedYZ molybdopterin-dependent catalytic subunit